MRVFVRRLAVKLPRDPLTKRTVELPGVVAMPIQDDDFERRGRLISLVYEVLRDMESPPDGATDGAMSSALSRAFAEKAIALANSEPAAPETGPKLPTPKQ
jgi:hypothetical protein